MTIFLLIFHFEITGSLLSQPMVSGLKDVATEAAFPWAGGLNACQFGQVDLDKDGIRDLVVFLYLLNFHHSQTKPVLYLSVM